VKNRHLLFSVGMNDLTLQTFTVPGPGGGGKDTSRTGCRLIHEPSGAVGEGREERSQMANRKRALDKLGKTKKFQAWAKLEAARKMGQVQSVAETPEQVMTRVDRMIADGIKNGDILIEEVCE